MYKMYEVDSLTLAAKNHSEDSNICGWYEAYASENLEKLKIQLRNTHWSWRAKIINVETNEFVTNSVIEKSKEA